MFSAVLNWVKTVRCGLLLCHWVLSISNRNASSPLILFNQSPAATMRSIVLPYRATEAGCNMGSILGESRCTVYYEKKRAILPSLTTAPMSDREKGWERQRIANPVICTSLLETIQCYEWPRLIHLSADTSRNIIRSTAEKDNQGCWWRRGKGLIKLKQV